METQRLRVVPPPPEGTPVLEQSGSNKGMLPFFSHDENAGPIVYACGNPGCDMILLDRPVDDFVRGFIFKCPRCDSFNQA